MTETEIINKIIAEMNQGHHYRFFDIWSRVTGNPIGGEVWRNERKKIFTLMINKGLIRHIINTDNDAIVELLGNGIKIKQQGGLKFDISKLKNRFWTFGKKFFFWLTLGGLGTYLTVWDRWIVPLFNERPNPKTEIIEPDSTKQIQPTEIQIVQDSSKTDSIKNHAVDSLDND